MTVNLTAEFRGPGGTGSGSDAFQRWLKKNTDVAAGAVTAGVTAAVEGLKTDLRGIIIRGGLGPRLANAVRSEIYPKGKSSLSAAGYIFLKGKKTREILAGFTDGVTIRSKNGGFLAVPTEAAGKYGDGRQKITPALWERRTGVKLRFIYRRGGPSLLVAELRAGTGKRGGFRKASAKALKSGRGLTTVVVFILLPQVTLKKRLEPNRLAQEWAARVPSLIERALPRDL